MKEKKLMLYYYKTNDSFYAFSVRAKSIKEAKSQIRAMLEKKTLHGVQFWKG